jgi:anti-sigma B factor antagonist
VPESTERLTVDTTDDGLIAAGEIDAHSVPALLAALDPLPVGGDVRVDMSAVDFMDSSGLRALIDAHQRAESAGRRVVVVQPSKAVRRVIEISGLADHLHVESAD